MGKLTGFLDYMRKGLASRAPLERIKDFNEFHFALDMDERKEQGARCMDCGVPFCHSSYGCPVKNLIPEWNDLVYKGQWEEAVIRLLKTNNFPEFTGRVCPAPCETACVLGINAPAVTIKDNECFIIDYAFAHGLIKPRIPQKKTGKKVAIIGSGPAGLAAADQLNQAGHEVVVFERAPRPGGLLMYGIPQMKLEKKVVERRLMLMQEEGVIFKTNSDVGRAHSDFNQADYDAILLCCGSTVPRDLDVPGRKLEGVYFAMDYLTGSTKGLLAGIRPEKAEISAIGKKVIVIGGGDTGNDCIGTAIRQGASSVLNFELLPKPPKERSPDQPWPLYPRILKNDYGHEEATAVYGRDPREFSIKTQEFVEKDGRLIGIKTVQVEWIKSSDGRWSMTDVPDTEECWDADLAFLALGFLGPEKSLLEQFKLEADARGNIKAEYGEFKTSQPGIFAAGDARRGQSLVVRAIDEGRGAAREVDRFLMGNTILS